MPTSALESPHRKSTGETIPEQENKVYVAYETGSGGAIHQREGCLFLI